MAACRPPISVFFLSFTLSHDKRFHDTSVVERESVPGSCDSQPLWNKARARRVRPQFAPFFFLPSRPGPAARVRERWTVRDARRRRHRLSTPALEFLRSALRRESGTCLPLSAPHLAASEAPTRARGVERAVPAAQVVSGELGALWAGPVPALHEPVRRKYAEGALVCERLRCKPWRLHTSAA